MTAVWVETMTVTCLKVKIQKRGLAVARNKPIFKEILLATIVANVAICTDVDPQMYPNPEDEFSDTTNWIECISNKKIPLDNPTPGNHARTNRLDTVENQVHELDELFDRPIFVEKSFEYV